MVILFHPRPSPLLRLLSTLLRGGTRLSGTHLITLVVAGVATVPTTDKCVLTTDPSAFISLPTQTWIDAVISGCAFLREAKSRRCTFFHETNQERREKAEERVIGLWWPLQWILTWDISTGGGGFNSKMLYQPKQAPFPSTKAIANSLPVVPTQLIHDIRCKSNCNKGFTLTATIIWTPPSGRVKNLRFRRKSWMIHETPR